MGSLTGKLKKIRTRKRLRQGTDRKAKLRKFGSTPKLPIHQKTDEPDQA